VPAVLGRSCKKHGTFSQCCWWVPAEGVMKANLWSAKQRNRYFEGYTG